MDGWILWEMTSPTCHLQPPFAPTGQCAWFIRQPLPVWARSFGGAVGFSLLEFGFCCGIHFDLSDRGFWKLWFSGARTAFPNEVALCDGHFGMFVFSFIWHLSVCLGGRGKGMQMFLLNSACFGQRKNVGRNEGNEP